MRKSTITIIAVVATFLIACGATPKNDTITPAAEGTGAAAATGAPAKTDDAPAGPKKFTVGQVGALTLGDGSTGEVTVVSVKFQGKSVVANVTVKCVTGKMSYNPFDWKALAGDGTVLNSTFDMDVKNQLSSGDIGAGQQVKGNVTFEGTAAQVKGAQIQYAPSLDTIAYWVAP